MVATISTDIHSIQHSNVRLMSKIVAMMLAIVVKASVNGYSAGNLKYRGNVMCMKLMYIPRAAAPEITITHTKAN